LLHERIKNGLSEDVYVLGSSRIEHLGVKHIHGNVDNLRIFGFTLVDFFATWNLLKKFDQIPNCIILGLDPWLLFQVPSITDSNISHPDAMEISSKLGLDFAKITNNLNPNHEHMRRLLFNYEFNLNAFKSLGTMTNRLWTQKGLILKDNSNNHHLPYYKPDGSFHIPAIIISKEQVLERAKNYYLNDLSISEYSKMSFEKLLKHVSTNTEITGLLLPFHPVFYKYIKDNRGDYLNQVESTFKAIFNDLGLSIVGSYNPDYWDIDEKYFSDEQHFSDDRIYQLERFKNIK
jgi:hypothetical protein